MKLILYRKYFLFLSLAYVLALLLNCSSQQKFIFSPKLDNSIEQKNNKSLAFEIFQDLRPLDPEIKEGYIFIPLIFWETIETYRNDFDLKTFDRANLVLSHALKKQIASHQVFKEVFVSNDSDWKDANYLVKGKILKTNTKKTRTFYGLSIFGAYIAILGLPFSYSQLSTEFEFELIEVKTNKILLTKKYSGHFSKLDNIYTQFLSLVKKENEFMENQLEKIATDFIEILKNQN